MRKLTNSVKKTMKSPCLTVDLENSVLVAAAKLRKHHIRHLPVLDGEKLVGIISDRDLPSGMKGLKSRQPIKMFMKSPVFTVKKTASLSYVTELMLENKISSVVVEDKNVPIGIITTEDLLQILYEALSDKKSKKSDLIGKVTAWLYDTPIGGVMDLLSQTGV